MNFHPFLVTIVFVLTYLSAKAEDVHVNIFNQFSIKTVVITPVEGKYKMMANHTMEIKLRKNNIVYFTVVGDSISAWDQDGHLGIFKQIIFSASSKNSVFKIEPAFPVLKARTYDGDLKIESNGENLKITNMVDVIDYLAGVVEGEAGPKAPFEFYKTQAIISRTYLYEIIGREGEENYNLADDVSHQVYLNRCYKNPQIHQAVVHTNDLVIVDSSMQLIMAAFHSNSGGQTANSEDVWLKPMSYLKSIADTFSINQKNAIWTDTLPVDKWLSYLKQNGIKISDDKARADNLVFNPLYRNKYYCYQDDTIPLRKIRQDFGFRSAWFSIKTEGNNVVFTGKGYGHGVGLSQEGAMEMARLNYSFLDIICFYYKDVKVVNYRQLNRQS
jgi:stage II sporulation protein D